MVRSGRTWEWGPTGRTSPERRCLARRFRRTHGSKSTRRGVSPAGLASTSAPANAGSSTWMCATSISPPTSRPAFRPVSASRQFRSARPTSTRGSTASRLAIGSARRSRCPSRSPRNRRRRRPRRRRPRSAPMVTTTACATRTTSARGRPQASRSTASAARSRRRLKLLFDFDSAELRPESMSELERLVKFMNDVPFATALIEGHTDSVGADAYNRRVVGSACEGGVRLPELARRRSGASQVRRQG